MKSKKSSIDEYRRQQEAIKQAFTEIIVEKIKRNLKPGNTLSEAAYDIDFSFKYSKNEQTQEVTIDLAITVKIDSTVINSNQLKFPDLKHDALKTITCDVKPVERVEKKAVARNFIQQEKENKFNTLKGLVVKALMSEKKRLTPNACFAMFGIFCDPIAQKKVNALNSILDLVTKQSTVEQIEAIMDNIANKTSNKVESSTMFAYYSDLDERKNEQWDDLIGNTHSKTYQHLVAAFNQHPPFSLKHNARAPVQRQKRPSEHHI